MDIICIAPRTNALWERLARKSPESSVFNSPAWLAVLEQTYGWKSSAFVAMDGGGEPQAGIAFFHIDDLIGERNVTLPFSDFCDPLGCDAHVWRTLGNRLIAQGCPVKVRCLHNEAPLGDERFAEANRARWHGIDLRPDLGTLWRNLDRTARQCIEKACRAGVCVEPAVEQSGLRTFFEMHLRVRKYKYHMLAQPYRFFEAIWEHFIEPGHGVLLLARSGDHIIAGGLFLLWEGGLYYKFNTSDPTGTDQRPNDLLVWTGIQYAKEHRCSLFDFGLSDWDQTGLVHYKRKFGTYEKTIHFLHYIPESVGSNSQHETRIRELFPQVTNLLTQAEVPDTITEQAGSVLYRYFT